MPRPASDRLMASPACPPPMTMVSVRFMTIPLSMHTACVSRPVLFVSSLSPPRTAPRVSQSRCSLLPEQSDPCREGAAPRQVDRSGTPCLLYTSDAADERSSVDLGGRRII